MVAYRPAVEPIKTFIHLAPLGGQVRGVSNQVRVLEEAQHVSPWGPENKWGQPSTPLPVWSSPASPIT